MSGVKDFFNKKPLRLIVLGFAVLVLAGACVLNLPVCTKSGESAGFMTALFTSASASCVTGLVVEDTLTYWSDVGHTVILTLIQIGGLGVMLLAGFVLLVLRKRVTVSERILIGHSISFEGLSGVVKMVRGVVFGTFVAEALGAVVLAARFQEEFGWVEGLKKGIFHSISAFCNAGFDLLGDYSSMSSYRLDPVVTFMLCGLIIGGGLGFYVWSDICTYRRHHKLKLHTKVVLVSTVVLLLGGTLGFFILEYGNVETIGNDGVLQKLMSSFFQSTTCRTAGYEQFAQADMTPASRLLTQILMFIGGSPGSTAGGIKTTVVAIVMMSAICSAKGGRPVVMFGRTVPKKTVFDAMAILVFAVFVVVVGAMFLMGFDSLSAEEAVFECISAFGTVGLSMGVTPTLSVGSQIVLVMLMFIGRAGILTFGLAMLLGSPAEQRIKRPDGKIII